MINQLLKSIFLSLALTLPLWIIARTLINIRKREFSLNRELVLTTFFIYIVLLAAMTIIPLPMTSFRNDSSAQVNLIPLVNSIKYFLPNESAIPEIMKFGLENIIGNIVLFVPLGFLLPLISDKFKSLKGLMVTAFFISLGIELIQFVSAYFGNFRTVDVDDVIFNIFGAFIGFYCLKSLTSIRSDFVKES